MKTAKGTPTDLNLFTLAHVFNGLDVVRNRLKPTSLNGVRRCFKAGLVESSRDFLTLTDLGRHVLCAWAFQRGATWEGIDSNGFKFKRCTCCGAEYTRAEWEALELIGPQSQFTDAGEVDLSSHLELRNCACRSTLSVEMPS
jgi:hypothetical protein